MRVVRLRPEETTPPLGYIPWSARSRSAADEGTVMAKWENLEQWQDIVDIKQLESVMWLPIVNLMNANCNNAGCTGKLARIQCLASSRDFLT